MIWMIHRRSRSGGFTRPPEPGPHQLGEFLGSLWPCELGEFGWGTRRFGGLKNFQSFCEKICCDVKMNLLNSTSYIIYFASKLFKKTPKLHDGILDWNFPSNICGTHMTKSYQVDVSNHQVVDCIYARIYARITKPLTWKASDKHFKASICVAHGVHPTSNRGRGHGEKLQVWQGSHTLRVVAPHSSGKWRLNEGL